MISRAVLVVFVCLGLWIATSWSQNGTPMGPVARMSLYAPTTYYANASTGNDANPCTSGSPCLTAQRLINLQQSIDNHGYAVTLSLADGNYPAGVVCNGPFVGGGTVTLNGDATTPTNVVLNNGATGIAVSALNYCQLTVTNMSLKGNNDLVRAVNFGIVTVSGDDFTATSGGAHLAARHQGFIFKSGPVTISGGAQEHELFANNGVIFDTGNATTFTASVTFTTAFISGGFDASANIAANSYAFGGHTVTGPEYAVDGAAILYTNGNCSNLPGSTAGVATNNGLCY
jgi:hypothetical protein